MLIMGGGGDYSDIEIYIYIIGCFCSFFLYL